MRSLKNLIFVGAIAAIVLVVVFAGLLAFGVLDLDDESKSIWDWLDLLIIPLSLVIVATILQVMERRTDRQIAEERTVTDREIARERVEAETLQSYLDSMGTLINTGGLDKTPTIRAMKARTSVTMRSLSSALNRDLIAFLRESYLLGKSVESSEDDDEANVVEPLAALLQGSNLTAVKLELTDLRDAYLSGANLSGANLREANLFRANLSGANLREANLREANLSVANLSVANLRGADLREANLSVANLSDANLGVANLSDANLFEAYLSGADLSEANLFEADLRGANLSDANLRGAEDYTNQQLAQARTLVEATLPDGTKIETEEQWLAFKKEHGGEEQS